jgi:hypothetical protein
MNGAGNRCSRSRWVRHHISAVTRQLTNTTAASSTATDANRKAATP